MNEIGKLTGEFQTSDYIIIGSSLCQFARQRARNSSDWQRVAAATNECVTNSKDCTADLFLCYANYATNTIHPQ